MKRFVGLQGLQLYVVSMAIPVPVRSKRLLILYTNVHLPMRTE